MNCITRFWKKYRRTADYPYLCDELIAEIFERLPPKSLIRLRCLSKSWYSRISSPNFIRMHALRSAKTPQKTMIAGHVIHYKKLGYRVIRASYRDKNAILISGSCNGIMLLNDWSTLSLCNPSIRRKLTLPCPPLRNNPQLNRVAFGFGFDAITDHYKVVGVSYIIDEGSANSSFVYSMKTNAWSEIASPTTSFLCVKSMACLVNGTLHWVLSCESEDKIMTFDLSTNVFGMISLPEPTWATNQLTTIKACLAAVISKDGSDTWIWVRREYNNSNNNVASWSKAFNLTSLGGSDYLLNNYLEDFRDYNPESGMRSRLVGFSDSSYHFHMDICVGSLELLDKDTY